MHVAVPALLLGALVSLVVGLATSTAGWLIACIALALLALLLSLGRRPAPRSPATAGPPGTSADVRSPLPWSATSVWVVDGRPRYHRQRCAVLADKPAEAIPLPQASEDGFTPCSLCTPPVYLPAAAGSSPP